MCDTMLLWNGAENKTAPFLLLEWETSSHYIAILGVSLHERNKSTVCPPIWWCPPPDATILGGFNCIKNR